MPTQFEDQGYLVIPDFISPTVAAELKAHALHLVATTDADQPPTRFRPNGDQSSEYFLNSGDQVRLFFEDGAFDQDGRLTVDRAHAINKIGHALHVHDRAFRAVTLHPTVVRIAQGLGLQHPAVLQSMVICKPPRIGGEGTGRLSTISAAAPDPCVGRELTAIRYGQPAIRTWHLSLTLALSFSHPHIAGVATTEYAVPPHQDSTFLFTRPLSAIGFWIALENCHETNGCLQFVPGSHKDHPITQRLVRTADHHGTEMVSIEPVYGPGSQAPSGAMSSTSSDTFVSGEVAAGTLVLIHGSVLHRSSPNRSMASRFIYTFHAIELMAAYPADNWLQPTVDVPFTRLY
ncbi:hypothetical protein IWQ60_010184 [Tieghemiomyces parasiticus]|uniref:Phytanoyl-CoA dioxygenase n=1 Tax=Tieghemiomyces parasiticus TaxID=78921 RepID=A0A9W7ZR99_9FUNG|nr:hypothetical protein IWQ60_010184 [Tieghemiomyces parasiticus]